MIEVSIAVALPEACVSQLDHVVVVFFECRLRRYPATALRLSQPTPSRIVAERRLYTFGRTGAWPVFEQFIAGRIHENLITAHWDDVSRLATSVRTGAASASLLLKRLGAYPRQNSLALALREIGRIERTLFMLDWFELPALRRQVTVELNKGEARNALARAVCFPVTANVPANRPAISDEMAANSAASRRRAPPKSVRPRTTPAETIPMQISLARVTARKKACPFGPPVAPSWSLATIATVYPASAAE